MDEGEAYIVRSSEASSGEEGGKYNEIREVCQIGQCLAVTGCCSNTDKARPHPKNNVFRSVAQAVRPPAFRRAYSCFDDKSTRGDGLSLLILDGRVRADGG
jgi:hypothetical protein